MLLKAQIDPLKTPSVINLKDQHLVVYGCDNTQVAIVGGTLEIKFGTVKDPDSNMYFTFERAELVNAIGEDAQGQHFFISGTFEQKLAFNPAYQDQFWSLDVAGFHAHSWFNVSNGLTFGAECSIL